MKTPSTAPASEHSPLLVEKGGWGLPVVGGEDLRSVVRKVSLFGEVEESLQEAK